MPRGRLSGVVKVCKDAICDGANRARIHVAHLISFTPPPSELICVDLELINLAAELREFKSVLQIPILIH